MSVERAEKIRAPAVVSGRERVEVATARAERKVEVALRGETGQGGAQLRCQRVDGDATDDDRAVTVDYHRRSAIFPRSIEIERDEALSECGIDAAVEFAEAHDADVAVAKRSALDIADDDDIGVLVEGEA